MIYFPTNWGAKEPQNLPNHRVDSALFGLLSYTDPCCWAKTVNDAGDLTSKFVGWK